MRIQVVVVIALFTCLLAAEDSGPKSVAADDKVLLKKVVGEFEDAPLGEACNFMSTLTGVKTQASQLAGSKPVTLKFNNVTIAEAMRQIKDKAGADYRIVAGEIRIAMPEEFTAIDAGKEKFKPYSAENSHKEKPAAASGPQPVGDEAKLLLEPKINLRVTDMEIGLALEWAKRLTESPLRIVPSEKVAKMKVSIEAIDATPAAFLGKIAQQTGTTHRVHDGTLQLVTKEELAAIQAGKEKFKPFVSAEADPGKEQK